MTTLASEDVAKMHEQQDQGVLAEISRLTTDQALNILCWLSGYDPELTERLLDRERAHRSQKAR